MSYNSKSNEVDVLKPNDADTTPEETKDETLSIADSEIKPLEDTTSISTALEDIENFEQGFGKRKLWNIQNLIEFISVLKTNM